MVRVEDLEKTPLAFQQYVSDWFKHEVIFGIPCMIASTVITGFKYEGRGKQPGIAPSHSVDIRTYCQGLKPDQDLGDWIRKHKKLVHTIYTTDDR